MIGLFYAIFGLMLILLQFEAVSVLFMIYVIGCIISVLWGYFSEDNDKN